MIMNVIMALSMYPTMLILFFVMKHLASSNKKLYFGVHLDDELRRAPEGMQADKNYRRRMLLVGIILAVIPCFFFFSHHVSIQFTLWMAWFLGGLAAMMIPYILANKEILSLKEHHQKNDLPLSEGLKYAELRTVQTVTLKEFLPQILLSVFGTLILFLPGRLFSYDKIRMEGMEVFIYANLTLALLTVLLYYIASAMDKAKVLVISESSEVNIAFSRARKAVWKNVWSLTSWINTGLILLVSCAALTDFHGYLVMLAGTILESFLCIFVILRANKKLQSIDAHYDAYRSATFDMDDDRFWIWGMFYNNPGDSRAMVPKRYGVGTTCNMATNVGKATILVAFLALVWIPFFCMWMIMEDFTPRHLLMEDTAIVCRHVKADYTIPYEEIKEVALLPELPQHRSKTSGTGTDNLEKGKYYSRTIGNYYCFLDPNQDYFLRIDTNNKIYILNGCDDAETLAVYELLLH